MFGASKQEGKGTYELAGRWRASPYRGKFVEIKFGKDKNSPLDEHMKSPLVSRRVTPGAPDALDGDELGFLRDLPGPVRDARQTGNNRAMLAGDAVLALHPLQRLDALAGEHLSLEHPVERAAGQHLLSGKVCREQVHSRRASQMRLNAPSMSDFAIRTSRSGHRSCRITTRRQAAWISGVTTPGCLSLGECKFTGNCRS